MKKSGHILIVALALLGLACDTSETTTTNNSVAPTDPTGGDNSDNTPMVVNTVNTAGICRETSTSILCTDQSFCQTSEGVAELCDRIAWACIDAATNFSCGGEQNGSANGDQQFNGLTPATVYVIEQTAFRANGDQQTINHNVTTEP